MHLLVFLSFYIILFLFEYDFYKKDEEKLFCSEYFRCEIVIRTKAMYVCVVDLFLCKNSLKKNMELPSS